MIHRVALLGVLVYLLTCSVESSHKETCDPGWVWSNGACIKDINNCVHTGCPSGQQCQNGRCTQTCLGVMCPVGSSCNNGKCQCDSKLCNDGYSCQQGMCQDVCLERKKNCAADEECIRGQCYSKCDWQYDPFCPMDQFCFNNSVCRGYCDFWGCSDGNTCVNGKCVCDSKVCKGAYKCSNGICQDECYLKKKTRCPDGYYCEAGMCKDYCNFMWCGTGNKCEGGKCICVPETCTGGFACDNGVCKDKCTIESKQCADGEYCEAGECWDMCQRMWCPKSCENGVCLCDSATDCYFGQSCLDGKCDNTVVFLK